MPPSRLAQLIAQQEGFGRPGAIPTVRRNPGNLRHGPNAQHPGAPNDVATYASDDLGWQDLERQLKLYAARNMTLRQMIAVYAPPVENNTSEYLEFVCDALAMTPDTTVRKALEIPGVARS